MKVAKRPRPIRYGTAFVVRRADGAILLRRRKPRGLLGGMSEVPGSEWSETQGAALELPFPARWHVISALVEHAFTHFELRLSVQSADVAANVPAPEGHWWAPASTLADEALPNVMKKTIEAAYPGATKRMPKIS